MTEKLDIVGSKAAPASFGTGTLDRTTQLEHEAASGHR
jgi:hypothetical protein